jgi:hypothetical protein
LGDFRKIVYLSSRKDGNLKVFNGQGQILDKLEVCATDITSVAYISAFNQIAVSTHEKK